MHVADELGNRYMCKPLLEGLECGLGVNDSHRATDFRSQAGRRLHLDRGHCGASFNTMVRQKTEPLPMDRTRMKWVVYGCSSFLIKFYSLII
jgi:hypothetical protein